MKKICAIHQPNFFPWLGYFDKIKKADIFVFLDDVQNQKTGSSNFNKVNLNYFGQKKYYTCPIKRFSGLTPINKIEFSDINWKVNFLNVIKNYYRNSKNFKQAYTMIQDLLMGPDNTYLCDFNIKVIQHITLMLGLKVEFVLKSKLCMRQTSSTQMLIEVCKAVGADTYLCGGGASAYQKDDLFNENRINLLYQNFKPTPYGDKENFIPGLSVIDYLMSILE